MIELTAWQTMKISQGTINNKDICMISGRDLAPEFSKFYRQIVREC